MGEISQGGARDESVRVIVRCRPLSSAELSAGYDSIIDVDSKRGSIALKNPKSRDESPREFLFDAAYHCSCSQSDIYDESFRPLVDSVLAGFNGTIFAYGQTGTGKTFTMEGVRDNVELRGVIPRSFEHIFNHISQSVNQQFLVRASYMEIYQEHIRDLLHQDHSRHLQLKERPDTGVYVRDLTSVVCKNIAEIHHIMMTGNANRSVGATNMNEHSSRSHAIFLVTVERGTREGGTANNNNNNNNNDDGMRQGDEGVVSECSSFTMGKLNLVDLAGSERQAKTGTTGDRFKEATKINLSLSALGNVISALVDGKSSHVPYRDSKLTRLLQDSLGGNARTIMVSNVGPASYNYDETLSTLRYASRAKNIKNRPQINEDPKDALLRKFQQEIAQLKDQLMTRSSSSSGVGSRQARVLTSSSCGHQGEQNKDPFTAPLVEDILLDEIQQKENMLENEKEATDQLVSKINMIEAKLLSGDGSSIEDTASRQQQELQKQRQIIVEQKNLEREMLQKLEREEVSRIDVQQTYSSLQHEVDVKNKKLKKLYKKLELSRRELQDCEEEFSSQQRDLHELQQSLFRELKLKTVIVESFVRVCDRTVITENTQYDDEEQCWTLPPSSSHTLSSSHHSLLHYTNLHRNNTTAATVTHRPSSARGSRGAATPPPPVASCRVSCDCASSDQLNTEQHDEMKILQLDMPERSTRDYVASSAVEGDMQAALQQALASHEQDISVDAVSSLHVSNFLLKASRKPPSARGVGARRAGKGGNRAVNTPSRHPPDIAPSPQSTSLYPQSRGLVPR